ncbi:MAG TPA: carboxymuconolactone decarboxylase family protein [Gemmatimonadaceae bacterium]|nr:carboxymuconolactone decarboxylase family protein [Gemmatimonadaceae bacterium]
MASIDEQTKWLVQIAAAIAGADEQTTRTLMERAAGQVDPAAVDEVIIQSYLFAGFPRTLNAARAWRTASGTSAPETDPTAELASGSDWIARGEQTCKTVYGESYEMLRENVRALHPALDSWMITDGYGKVLSRPGLSLRTRELCIVAACAASGQQRQLHSHLHGALNAGALTQDLMATLDALGEIVDPELLDRYRSLLSRVAASRRSAPVESADVG